MRKTISYSLICLLLLFIHTSSFASEPNRVYRGKISGLGYDLEENRVRVDVQAAREGESGGRGQLYFGNNATIKLAEMIHLAFINKIPVEIWVIISDPQGRANVIHTVNLSSPLSSPLRIKPRLKTQ